MHRACLSLRSSTNSVGGLSELLTRLTVNSSSSLPNTSVLINYESRRWGMRHDRKWLHWPNDFLPFKWERPKTDPPYLNTGDAVRDIGYWDHKALIPGAEHSTELENAPEIVRRQFSLEFADRKDVVEFQRRRIIQLVQRHPFDDSSPEVRIARMTIRIRNNLHHFSKIDKDDARRKIVQEGLKNKRALYLKRLYYQDRERYEYIKRILGIEHTPPQLGVGYSVPTRKGELRRLTKEYCDAIKEEKLRKYQDELKEKQVSLAQEMEKLEQLMKDEKYLGIENQAK